MIDIDRFNLAFPLGIIIAIHPEEIKTLPGEWELLNVRFKDSERRVYRRVKI